MTVCHTLMVMETQFSGSSTKNETGQIMKINDEMNLWHLAELMGDVAGEADAEKLRDVLVRKYDGMSTDDLREGEFLAAINEAFSE